MNKEELKHYRYMQTESEELRQQISALTDSVIHSPVIDGQPRGSSASGDPTGALAEKRLKLEERLEDCRRKMAKIENTVAAIENTRERLVLEYRYIRGMRWDKIAERLHYSYDSVMRIHRQALRNLES